MLFKMIFFNLKCDGNKQKIYENQKWEITQYQIPNHNSGETFTIHCWILQFDV